MIWVHKSLSKITDHYKYWSDRILEIRCKINRGYLTILGLYAPEEGRQELTDDFYEQLQNIYDKINKNYYILMLGDSNVRAENNKTRKTIQRMENNNK
jgi:exonuclease III